MAGGHGRELRDFIKRLNGGQEMLRHDSIKVSNDDRLQHFIEQMYDGGQFEWRDYQDWEDRPDHEKTWAETTKFFEALIETMETYEDNIGGTAKKAKFENAVPAK